jgi:hypothetical protein
MVVTKYVFLGPRSLGGSFHLQASWLCACLHTPDFRRPVPLARPQPLHNRPLSPVGFTKLWNLDKTKSKGHRRDAICALFALCLLSTAFHGLKCHPLHVGQHSILGSVNQLKNRCTNCCTIAFKNALKRAETTLKHLYFTTTYARLGHFVIGRSSVQVRSSAPVPLFTIVHCTACSDFVTSRNN